MDTFKIEKGVPIPWNGWEKVGKWKTLALKMKVGDSVLVGNESQATSLRAALKSHNYKMKCKVITRKQDEGIRVWLAKLEPNPEHE